MITPDVVLYFCGVHSSHVHKYLNLNKKLNEKCNAILILDNGKWGVSKDHLEKFKKEDLENVYHLNYNDALTALNSLKYKLAVLSSNFRKGTIESRDCQIAKSKGAKTLQVSEMNIDFYYSGADYVSLISENFEKRTSLSSTLKVLDDQKLFSNCFLWDNIEDCLPYTLTKDAFCKKYGLNPNENILMWGPDSIQCQHEGAQIAYRAACNLKNVIVKLHPNELRRHKAERVDFKWSHDLYADSQMVVLDPIDTHWAFKYMDCLLCYSSTLALEAPMYRKPTVYINHDDDRNMLFNCDPDIAYKRNYQWVGKSCKSENLSEFMKSNSFLVSDLEYDKYLEEWLQDSSKLCVDILCDQILELI